MGVADDATVYAREDEAVSEVVDEATCDAARAVVELAVGATASTAVGVGVGAADDVVVDAGVGEAMRPSTRPPVRPFGMQPVLQPNLP